jgi:hypothetical protein
MCLSVCLRALRAQSVFCVVFVGVRGSVGVLVFVRVRVRARLCVDAHVSVRACGYAMAWQCHCAQMRLDEAMARALMEMDEAVSQAETRAPLSEEAEADRRAQVAGGRAGGRAEVGTRVLTAGGRAGGRGCRPIYMRCAAARAGRVASGGTACNNWRSQRATAGGRGGAGTRRCNSNNRCELLQQQ